MKKIIPAILTNDVTQLQAKLMQLRGLCDWVQIDIMDGRFVNNTSITLEDIFQVKASKDFSLEVHLMVLHPETYFLQCKAVDIKRVIFHGEAGNIETILSEAEKFHFQKGLALNPETSIDKIVPYLDRIDVVVLMSVKPGFGGQAFILKTLDKIKELKNVAPKLKIEVDGGINLDNIGAISDAGADYFVVGESLFKSDLPMQAGNIKERFRELQLKLS